MIRTRDLAKIFASAVLFGGILAAAPLSAQDEAAERRSHTQGLLLNLHFSAASLSTDAGSDGGGGGGLAVGYGVSRKVLLYLQFDVATIDIKDQELQGSFGLGHGDLGVRYTFANEANAFIPYLNGALSGIFAGAEIANRDISLQGGGVKLGGGFGWFFIPQLSLDANLSFTFGTFNSIKIDDVTIDIDSTKANSTRVEVGLSWYPQA